MHLKCTVQKTFTLVFCHMLITTELYHILHGFYSHALAVVVTSLVFKSSLGDSTQPL
jgi:hypothetical protein